MSPTLGSSSSGRHRLQRRLDLLGPGGEVGHRFVAEQPGQLTHELPELLRLGGPVAQDRELVRHQRMAADD